MNHQFVENLIALRNRYQSLLEEMERKSAHAKEQQSHVNALLFDSSGDDEGFGTTLMELRNRYQAMAHQCGSKASHARVQITHVNALLADQLVWQQNQPVSIQTLPLDENKNRSLKDPADIDSDRLPKQADDVDEINVADAADELEPVDELEQDLVLEADPSVQDSLQKLDQDLVLEADTPVQDAELELALDETNSPNSAHKESATTMVPPELETIDELEPQSSADPESGDTALTRATISQFPPLKTPMLPEYQHLTRFQAVEGILQQKAGSILHIDYIIRALHGNLPEDDVLAEKARMSKTLSEGALSGLWDKMPGVTKILANMVSPILEALVAPRGICGAGDAPPRRVVEG